MKTILVTGGAGFIGSHVTRGYIKAGYRVVVFDDLSTGRKDAIPKKAHFAKGDVRDNKALARTFLTYQPDIVCHIAGRASNIGSYMDPRGDIEVNYFGSVNVVLASLKYKVKRFVYASSMLAAGPDGPSSYYGVSKYAAERFIHLTARRPDIAAPFDVTSLRMFNVFGPGQSITNPYQGVLAIFIGNVLRGEEIKIFGSGDQSRDFISVHDVVDVWVRVVDAKETYGKVLDVGSGRPTSINVLARSVIRAAGANPKTYPIVHLAPRPGDIPRSAARLTQTKRLLPGWRQTSFTKALTETIAWAREDLRRNGKGA